MARTKLPVAIALSLAFAVLVVELAGVGAIFTGDPASQLESGDALNDSSDTYNVSQGVEGSADSQDGELVGVLISSGEAFFNVVAIATLLPFELRDMGFPVYFAYPVGVSTQLILWIGGAQWITGRMWQ